MPRKSPTTQSGNMTPFNHNLTTDQVLRLHTVIIHNTTKRLALLMFSDRRKRFEFLRNPLGYALRTARLNQGQDIVGMNMDRAHYQTTLQTVNQAIRQAQRFGPSEEAKNIEALLDKTSKSCDTILAHLTNAPPTAPQRP